MPQKLSNGSVGAAFAAATCIMAATPAASQMTLRHFTLPAQALGVSLRAVAIATRTSIITASGVVAGKVAPPLDGDYSVEDAVSRLLAGSGLRSRRVGAALIIEPVATQPIVNDDEGEVIVTGTRIRGAAVSSPVISLQREAIRATGQATLAEALRTLPQNFNGGQNPGIGFNVPEANGADVGGGSSVNLRGLGSDATLTLLNGRRLSYSAAAQSIDISAIPFGAVQRVEVVPDGASALFGSDAVAGVVNVILRRDLDGLEAGARLGETTDGGYFQQQYGATAGRKWASGNLLLAYEYGSNSSIEAGQRSYARERSPGLTLFPEIHRHSAALSGGQALTGKLRFDVDALVNRRSTDQIFPLNEAGDLTVSAGTSFTTARSWLIAPGLKWQPGGDWQVALFGSYGRDRVHYGGDLIFGATRVDAGNGTYRNVSHNAELSGDGSILHLPGGNAKLAAGLGYRRNDFARTTSAGATQNTNAAQDSYYAFGELSIPLVAPEQGVALIHRLGASAALRYERYPGVGEVATPKLGLNYAPTPDLDLKASWGRSFRAPTLFQRYQPRNAYLIRAASLGGRNLPTDATAILLLGGSDTLEPERSRNWSATAALHPRATPGLSLELSYFSVRYTNRIVTPVPFISAALSDPLYASRVVRKPDAAAQAAVIQTAFFTDITGGAGYDPTRVAAIVDNTSVNAGRQRAHGIDALARYDATLGNGDRLTSGLNASYLESDQRIGTDLPTTKLAGTLFSPPHLRLRGDAGLTHGLLSFNAAISYIGSVRDRRSGTDEKIGGMTPVDLTLRMARPPGGALLDGLDIIFSVQNAFNDKPSPIAVTLFYDTPYDSTNYAPFGRTVTLSVLRKW